MTLLDKWLSDTHPDNQERREFCCAMPVLFPHMSDNMVVKCWRALAAGDGYWRSHLTRQLFAAAAHKAGWK